MEYKLSVDFGWQDVTGTAITGLVPGTYEVRVKESGVVGFSRVVPVTVGARPNVVSITPSGTSAPITSTELVITFDAQMDPLKGTVAINGTAITEEPAWSDDKKVAVYPLPSLDYKTTYNVTLSGFENGPGIPMTSFTSHSFTTEPDPTKADAASGSGTLANTGDNAPHLPAFALLALSGLLAFALRSTRQRSDS